MSRTTLVPDHDEATRSEVITSGPSSMSDPGSMSRRRGVYRAIGLLLLTVVLPGSAQLTFGNKGLGRWGLRVWAATLATAVALGLSYLVMPDATYTFLLGTFTRTWFLLSVIVVLVLVAGLWTLLFVDAWRLGRPRLLGPDARRLVGGLTAMLVVLTSGTLVLTARQVSAGRDFIGAVFGGSTALGPVQGRYNVLLLGADTGKGRVGTRPDSINLVSVDATSGRSVTFGFARDTENINFKPGSLMKRLMPGGWNCGDDCLLNALYQWGTDHKQQFPADVKDPGLEATREAVEALSGLTVHYYVMIDLFGFKQLVNAVGGLDVYVKKRTPIGGGTGPIVGWIEPGSQHLDGLHALWYARSREGSTDYERMARQRCVMTAMLQQLDPQTVIFKFQDLAAASTGVIRTDLPESELGRFADLALKAKEQKIKSVNFVPPLIKPWSYNPALIISTVQSTIAASEKSEQESGGQPAQKSAQKPARKLAATSLAKKSVPAGGGARESDLTSVCSAG